MGVLDVEERKRRIDLSASLFEKLRDVGVVGILPVGADKGVPMDVLHPNRLVFLVEELFPEARAVVAVANRLLGGKIVPALVRIPPRPPFQAVVAIDEELFDMLAVETLVAREDGIPRVGEHLQFPDPSLVRYVTGDNDSIRPALAEKLKCLQKMLFVAWLLYVHVAYDAEADIRAAAAEKPAWSPKRAPAVQERERPARANKRPPREFSVVHFTPCI